MPHPNCRRRLSTTLTTIVALILSPVLHLPLASANPPPSEPPPSDGTQGGPNSLPADQIPPTWCALALDTWQALVDAGGQFSHPVDVHGNPLPPPIRPPQRQER